MAVSIWRPPIEKAKALWTFPSLSLAAGQENALPSTRLELMGVDNPISTLQSMSVEVQLPSPDSTSPGGNWCTLN